MRKREEALPAGIIGGTPGNAIFIALPGVFLSEAGKLTKRIRKVYQKEDLSVSKYSVSY
jgi:hypothetical protein